MVGQQAGALGARAAPPTYRHIGKVASSDGAASGDRNGKKARVFTPRELRASLGLRRRPAGLGFPSATLQELRTQGEGANDFRFGLCLPRLFYTACTDCVIDIVAHVALTLYLTPIWDYFPKWGLEMELRGESSHTFSGLLVPLPEGLSLFPPL